MEAGVEIPKLCATDMLDAFGSCRVCLVEIEGRRMKSVPGGTHWGGGVSISARDQARIGQMLLDRFTLVAASRGADRLHLEVRDGNSAALRLYESLGFSVAGRRQNYYMGVTGERFDAITMRRDLA